MAAGRGEFFASFFEGLRRKQNPNCGLRAAGSRRQGPVYMITKNIELPSEVLLNILSHLDASSLCCVGLVAKLFHRLAADNVLWQKMYVSHFGSRTWRPKPAVADDEEEEEEEEEAQQHRAAGYWKKMYFRSLAGQEVKKWRREKRDVNPFTGLPDMTGRTLKNLNVSWELTLCREPGSKVTMEPSRADFFDSSVIVLFRGGPVVRYPEIRSLSLHGVRKGTARPGWRSLLFQLDVRSQPGRLSGDAGGVKLRSLQPGVSIGTWGEEDSVLFIMVSLHFHQLVERSLLGSPVCPYSEPAQLPYMDHSDPASGLHGYSLHLVLHNHAAKIMSRTFLQLRCHSVQDGLLELRVVDRKDLSQHRALSGSITLPWSSEGLDGCVENCCILSLTLLDEFQKPFWCVSSSVFVAAAVTPPSDDYAGEHFLLRFLQPEGRLRMELVRLTGPRQFMLIGLVLQLPVLKVNERFGREY
ncbi:F-box only protein 15-like isoform X2 [Clinocottus analis]|uniref:F-box only protein 15-like isoform X2 n=1 Tax=Clinocottus analis TaxID=304258 RepID=UPI0035BF3796